MAKPLYKLSTVLFGHTSDVRAIATFADRTIVSASRDKTARIWKPTGTGKDYTQSATLKGHSNFVSSVCIINPSEKNPTGFIVTGSNDKTICLYIPGQLEPVNVLTDHTDTVCQLKTGKEEGTFLSSSWDRTAKLWNTDDLSKPQVTLQCHTAAVWCVADLSNGFVVTGSADKLVIVWTKNGSIQHKLTGHTDCVRDVAAIKSNEFLTCANDATVRHWNASLGTCLGTYSGHENYIYSILATENAATVFTSSEDMTIRIWHNGDISQTIAIPAQSIWCIGLLPNGDIVAGSSDGIVRIFSCDPERYADEEMLAQFEREAGSAKLNARMELGGIKVKDLPDARALQQAGQRDGQTKMVNDGNKVKAYSWSQSERRWIEIGEVMGASGGSAATSGKQLHNGIEYDYVFSVDIQDGVPPLKLPYNNGQDPWHVAQKFLHDNELSQLYLDQVANFIVKNSTPATVVNTSATHYADPFTGTSRYVPESTMHNSKTNSAEQESLKATAFSSSNASMSQSYIPHTNYLKLEQANLSAIQDKLRELNSKQTDAHKVSDEELQLVIKLAENQVHDELKSHAVQLLIRLLDWSNETVFPVLDITRLAILHKNLNDALCTNELLEIIKRHIKSIEFPSNQMLAFRLLANMFSHEKGEKLCLTCKDEILKALIELDAFGSKTNQVAVSTYLLNIIVALNKYNDTPGKTQSLNVMFFMLPRLSEPEAVFRALVGLGTILSATPNPEDRNELIEAVRQSEAALNVLKTISETEISANTSNKLANCSKQIIDLII